MTSSQPVFSLLRSTLFFIMCCLSMAMPYSMADTFDAPFTVGPHIKVSLLYGDTALVPGKTTMLGVLFSPESEWHTYWRNPGDSGEAPTIEWQASEAFEFGEIQWPLPIKI